MKRQQVHNQKRQKMKNLLQILHKFSSIQKSSLQSIPTLKEFMKKSTLTTLQKLTQLKIKKSQHTKLTFHIQTYGCQMNVNDSEIIRSVLLAQYQEVQEISQANIVLLNTCAIREASEEKIHSRVRQLKKNKVIGVLGCMAERLKQKMFESGVHVVCGPDAYRDLPRLLNTAIDSQQFNINTQLSVEETYADVAPIRKDKHSVSAFLSIMRGCNNMCSFCIVPFVRGRERSRNIQTILAEIASLQQQGVKEITFLGQNVNSYHDLSTQSSTQHQNSQGFSEIFKLRNHSGLRFSDLLEISAKSFENIRFRFISPHPKNFPDEVLDVIARHNNICKAIHLPAQSGSTEVLSKMRRNHTREAYLELVKKMRQKLPNLSLSTDLICGFCGETQEQFQETLSLLKEVKYDMAYLYAYSMREKTPAHRKYQDDVPEEIKQKRLKRMISTFVQEQATLNLKQLNTLQLLLLDGRDKRNPEKGLMGKTDHFKNGYVEIKEIPVLRDGAIIANRSFKIGDFVMVKVIQTGKRSLTCTAFAIADSLTEFYNEKNQTLIHQLATENSSGLFEKLQV